MLELLYAIARVFENRYAVQIKRYYRNDAPTPSPLRD